MNPSMLTIGGLASLTIAKKIMQSGSGNVYADQQITFVSQKLSEVAVIKTSRTEEENIDFIRNHLLSLKDKPFFQEMIQNLLTCSISESNKIYYFEMSKRTFKKVIDNYLKCIQMWFSSPFLDLTPSNIDIKRSWFTKGANSIKTMENLFYKNNFFYAYCGFKKLPLYLQKEFLSNNLLLWPNYL